MKKFLVLTAAWVAAGLLRADITPIEGANNVGFITVSSVTNLAIISVPFEQCLGSGTSGMLSDLVSTNGLISHASDPTASDQLVALTTNESGATVYYYYWLKTGAGWTTNVTTLINKTQTNAFSSPLASAFPVSRGIGFWLVRPAGAPSVDLFLKGQIPTSAPAVALKPGLSLIGLGALAGKGVNDPAINWGDRYDGGGATNMDKLLVVGPGGSSLATYYFSAASNKWLNANRSEATATIDAGYGFWYQRRGSTTNQTFAPVVP
jgi:hypothetical protein